MLNRKKVIRPILMVTILIFVLIGFVMINDQISQDRKNSFIPVADNNKFAYQIEDMYVEDGKIVIRGWFFELKKVRNVESKSSTPHEYSLVLCELKDNNDVNLNANKVQKTGICMDMEYETRKEVNAYFSCEYDYSNCGFMAKIDSKKIDLENGEYQLAIKFDVGDSVSQGLMTNTYVYKGLLSYINPKDVVELDIEGTDLEEIIRNGNCVVSIPKYHIFVYQNEWKLFWIADQTYPFDNEGHTYVQCQIDTTQFDKIPNERKENGYFWNHIGADFEAFEVTNEMNCGRYRVYERDLPKDYSITSIVTGHYDEGKWVWQSFFRPLYDFK